MRNERRSFRLLRGGGFLVLAGLLCNEWILAQVFSSDGVLQPLTRVQIAAFQWTLVSIGLVLLLLRERRMVLIRALLVLFGISVPVILWLLLEASLLVAGSPDQVVKTESASFYRPDEQVGYWHKPDLRVRASARAGKQELYDVEYAFDGQGRRITPESRPEGRDKFILFFGCSHTFGEGVKGDETLPAVVSRLAPGHKAYNYGVSGQCPTQMLAKLQTGQLPRELTETRGEVIFNFLYFHVPRVIGSMGVLSTSGPNYPYYFIDDQGNLVRNGTFLTAQPLMSRFYGMLGKSRIVRHFEIELPRSIRDEHLDLTVKVLVESKKALEKQLRDVGFHVLFFPDWQPDHSGPILERLQKEGVHTLDYRQLFDRRKEEFHIPVDQHPNALAYRLVAEKLVQDLGIGAQ